MPWIAGTGDLMSDVVDPAVFEAMRASLGDPETLRRVLTLFVSEANEQLERIRHLSTEAPEDGRVAAHRLKGNAGMLGAEQLAVACRRLELAIDERRSAELPDLAASAVAECERAVAWVNDRLAEL
jgi:HPt (histidine-containing phosphotransfer) domain-containing protein